MKGQSTAEYAVLLGLVVAAFVAMQTYVKRGLQGSYKYAVDKSKIVGNTGQYEPYYLESDYNTTTLGYTEEEKFEEGGKFTKEIAKGGVKTTNRTGTQIIHNVSEHD